MGIYDREYIRVGPRAQSGLGGLRFISFNTWLIILNAGVFLLNNYLFAAPTAEVLAKIEYRADVPEEARAQAVIDFRMTYPVADPRLPGAYAHPIVIPARLAGDQVVRGPHGGLLGDVIGQQVFIPMAPVQAVGHFSTQWGFYPGLQVWRLITFQFLHANFIHLFFNMFGLWLFGGMVEQYLGFKRYAAFYLTCGIFGGVGYLLLNLLGVLVNHPATPLVGASAGVFGVIMAAAFIAPNAIVQLLFPPVPLPLWMMAYGYVALAAINLLTMGQNAGGDAAHLGGAAAGYFFIRNTHLLRDFFDVFGKSGPARAGHSPYDIDPGEVDRILDKVRDRGLGSLTDRERDRLRRHSERLRRRG